MKNNLLTQWSIITKIARSFVREQPFLRKNLGKKIIRRIRMVKFMRSFRLLKENGDKLDAIAVCENM